jgi:pimeloyl-ACP methyl ester carboxylesterase
MQLTNLICLALAVSGYALPMIPSAADDEPEPATPPTPKPTPPPRPERNMDPDQLIKYWGYPAETLKVETEDGYILNLYRIPHGRNDNSTVVRPVVLLLHGFKTSSADWLVTLPHQSAPFVFADGGFDVYVGNFRGTKYARQHTGWDPSTYMFWQFSLDEFATRDLPKMIDAALQKSQAKQLYLVAHSSGATAAFVHLATSALIQTNKVKQLHAIAPLLYTTNVQGPLKQAAPLLRSMNTASSLFGLGEFINNKDVERTVARQVCQHPDTDINCKNILFMISGPDTRQIDESRIEVINGHRPAGTSVQNIVHLAQQMTGGQPQQYDYGNAYSNLLHYKSSQPPIINLTGFKTRTYLYSSECDWIAQVADVETAKNKHGAAVIANLIVPSFNHMDFLWGTRAAAEVYKPILFAMADDFLTPTPKPTP